MFRVAFACLVLPALLLAVVTPAPSHAMTVQPVVVDLKPAGRGSAATISVENSFTTPLPVELTIQSLTFDDKGVKPTGKDPGDVLVFPPQALIPPGQTQSFRVQWVGDPTLAKSQHYFVTVAQLPVKLPEGQSAIQILYDFQVLVSVAASQGEPHLSITSTSVEKIAPQTADDAAKPGDAAKPAGAIKFQPQIVVQNSGPTYGYVSHSRMTIVEKDASGKEVFKRTLAPEEIQQTLGFGLIGPETSRTLTVPVDLPSETGTVTVELSGAGTR